ncbi:MAG: F0F1 ATP synthase subunit gamma [Desulforhabdus sp.]|jgi:F-type H+-transporting ATPase subunit gamma|nr:F0F1 ATP synthase subunit gamma [Desulforhabdus sp.]
MEAIEELRRKITSAEDLQSIVRTMKALAAVSVRQYEMALESLDHYYRTISRGLQIVVKKEPSLLSYHRRQQTGRSLAVVLGSDYGMVGQFNDQIVSYAMARLDSGAEELEIWAMGERIVSRIERRGRSARTIYSAPSSVNGVASLVQHILLDIEDANARQQIETVSFFYNRPIPGATFESAFYHLLPIDENWLRNLSHEPWPNRALPTYTMESSRLFSALIRQFLFVSIYRAIAESLASENASRLAAMQGAEKNIEDRLGELQFKYHQQRQSTITEELMDVVSGFEALTQ